MNITVKKVSNGYIITTQATADDLYDDFDAPRGHRNMAKQFIAKDVDEMTVIIRNAFTTPPQKVKVERPQRPQRQLRI